MKLAAALATVSLLALGIAAPAASAKKKGGGGGAAVNITKTVNLPIPTRTTGPAPQDGVLTSTIEVGGKRLKGMRIRDVNASVQTLGTSGISPVDDLIARLVAPNGVHSFLFDDVEGFSPATNLSLGPLTLDDEALFDLGDGVPDNATMLFAPWFGSAAPQTPLFPLDNGPVSGTWRLDIFDDTSSGTSSLVAWGLTVVPGKPFKPKR